MRLPNRLQPTPNDRSALLVFIIAMAILLIILVGMSSANDIYFRYTHNGEKIFYVTFEDVQRMTVEEKQNLATAIVLSDRFRPKDIEKEVDLIKSLMPKWLLKEDARCTNIERNKVKEF